MSGATLKSRIRRLERALPPPPNPNAITWELLEEIVADPVLHPAYVALCRAFDHLSPSADRTAAFIDRYRNDTAYREQWDFVERGVQAARERLAARSRGARP